MRPSADSFAALARSSPWRWSTLRFTERRSGPAARADIRAWLRRPDLLRVETAAGGLIQVVRERRQRGPQDGPRPILRSDGLVDLRPDPPSFDSYDAPMFQAFALSVGVANVRGVLDRIDAPPAFITRAAEGRGFEELARAILAQRGRRPANRSDL